MIEYIVVYNKTNGALEWKLTGPPGTGAYQQVPDMMAVLTMPYEAFIALPGDLSPLKTAVTNLVNQGAGAFRLRFITDVPGQQATYLAKEAEAKAWTTGGNAANFPYLSAEATDTGSTVDAVAALVLATAEQWRALDPKIEGRRRGASVAIAAASNIAAIVEAGQVDWPSLLTPSN